MTLTRLPLRPKDSQILTICTSILSIFWITLLQLPAKDWLASVLAWCTLGTLLYSWYIVVLNGTTDGRSPLCNFSYGPWARICYSHSPSLAIKVMWLFRASINRLPHGSEQCHHSCVWKLLFEQTILKWARKSCSDIYLSCIHRTRPWKLVSPFVPTLRMFIRRIEN